MRGHHVAGLSAAIVVLLVMLVAGIAESGFDALAVMIFVVAGACSLVLGYVLLNFFLRNRQ